MRFFAKTAILALLLLSLVPFAANAADLNGANGDIDEHALFRVVGAMYGLDPELLEAVAQVESAGRSDAISPKGAVGLMQLMPGTAARYGVRDARDPVENALGAARYLAYLREATSPRSADTNDALSRILAAYNAGEGAVWRYDGLPPYEETQQYVARVLWVYLLGITPPRARTSKTAPASSAKAIAPMHHGDQDALDQLDSLRRDRATAAAAETSPSRDFVLEPALSGGSQK